MDKYLHFTIEELALEESFINWVKERNVEDQDFWNRWLESNPNEKSKIDKARSLVGKIKIKDIAIDAQIEDKVWNKVKGNIDSVGNTTGTSKMGKRIAPWLGLAAGLLALVYFAVGLDTETNINTSMAQTESITLPDGSTVDINAGSSLSYDQKAFLQERTLKLDGEAFFNVKKGSTFTVITNNGSVEVLGTSFNVFTRASKLEVQCLSGKVAVLANEQKTILAHNQQVEIIQNGRHEKSNIERLIRSDWRKGLYRYEDKNFGSIVADIERQWDVKLILDKGIEELKFTGSFNSEKLELALSEVCWPLDLEYSIEGKTISIVKK